MTHTELVRNTAEKMAAVRYGTGWDNVPNGIWKESATSEMIPLAELAVAMKAEGYKKGKEHTELLYQSQHSDDLKTNEEHMIYLGLTKPTENEQ